MKNLIVFALVLLSTTFAFAQRTKVDPTKKIQQKVDRMTEQLNLSAEQQESIKGLFTEQQEARMATKKGETEITKEEAEALKVERKTARKDFNTKLNNILTPEQQEIYNTGKRDKKNKAKGKAKKGKKGKNKSPEQQAERKVAKLTSELGLNDDQQKQMMDLMLERDVARKAASQAKKQATSKEDHEALKTERQAAKVEHQAKFESILTTEQLATYKEGKAARKAERKMDGKSKKKMDKRK